MPGADEKIGFDAFLPEDFDAYLPEKWGSNAFTLPRRKVKGKLEAIGRRLGVDLRDMGLSLVMHLSEEFPSLWNNKRVDTQWLFFSRDEAARAELTDLIDKERTLAATLADPTPLYRHVFIGVAFSQGEIEVGVRLHHEAWVDRRNLASLVAREDGVSRLATLVAELPEHYEVGLVGRDASSPLAMNCANLAALVAEFEASGGWLFVGARLPRDQVIVLGADVLGIIEEVVRHVAPVLGLVAWSPENDAILIDTLVAERSAKIEASRAELERERAEREVRRREEGARGLKLKEEIAERVRDAEAWRQREMAARRAASAREAIQAKQDDARARAEGLAAKLGLGGGASGGPAKAAATAPSSQQGAPVEEHRSEKPPAEREPARKHDKSEPSRSAEHERAADVQLADVVEVRKGFLKGRRGIVQEIDDKGGLRIAFGALSSRLSIADVVGLGPTPTDRPRDGGPVKPIRKAHGATPSADTRDKNAAKGGATDKGKGSKPTGREARHASGLGEGD